MRVKDRLTLLIILLLLSLSMITPIVNGTRDSVEGATKNTFIEGKRLMKPFKITSNEEFEDITEEKGFRGAGTKEDPFVIEDLNILGYDQGYSIWIENTTVDFIIQRCYLRRTGDNSSIHQNAGLVMKNVTDGLIRNCNLSNNENNIIARDCEDITFKDNHLYGSYRNLQLKGSSDVHIADNLLKGEVNELFNTSHTTVNDNTFMKSSLSLDSATNNTIENNFFNGSTLGIEGSSYNIIKSNSFIDNHYGIHIEDEEQKENYISRETKITENRFESNSCGIKIKHVESDHTLEIIDNHFKEGGSAIAIVRSKGLGIRDNRIEKTNASSIISFSSTHVEMINNTITGSEASGIYVSGIYLVYNYRSPGRNKIIDNKIKRSASAGIKLNYSQGNKIVNNRLIDNKKGIVKINECRNNEIHDNYIVNRSNEMDLFELSSFLIPMLILLSVVIYFILVREK